MSFSKDNKERIKKIISHLSECHRKYGIVCSSKLERELFLEIEEFHLKVDQLFDLNLNIHPDYNNIESHSDQSNNKPSYMKHYLGKR